MGRCAALLLVGCACTLATASEPHAHDVCAAVNLTHAGDDAEVECHAAGDCTFTAAATEPHHVEESCASADAGEHGGEHSEHEPHYHFAILFMFVGLSLGAVTQYILSQRFPSVPFTAVMLIEGILIAFIFELAKKHRGGLGELSASITMWSEIDPHLLLFAFVPALLFGDAMALDTHIFFKCLTQCLLLAGPGVLFGTFVTGACAKYILPYGWGWELSLIFGSILSATDPVAVVALLKSLGASPTLTMQITGESLLNDGTAIVVFNLFFNMYHDATKTEYETYTATEIIIYFFRLALGGVAVGIAFGLVTVWFIQRASHKTKPEDSTTQLLLTLCCAYLSFYVGEEICEVSGVLTNVSAALVLSKYGWPSFCDSHAMHVVWHAFETIGNTLIFLLAGLIIGESIWEGHNNTMVLGFSDWGYMLIFFGLMSVIRASMIIISFPILQRTGYGTTFADAFFMTWGGLRGAIGLALAMIVKQSINVEDGQRIIFLVGTLATCTLLINGTTSGFVLRRLGLIATPKEKTLLLSFVQQRMRSVMDEEFTAMKARNDHFKNVDRQAVRKYCTALDPSNERSEHTLDLNPKRKSIVARLSTSTRGSMQKMKGVEAAGDNTSERMNWASIDTLELQRERGYTSMEREVAAQMQHEVASMENEGAMEAITRGVFLSVLKSEYDHLIDSGVLPHKDRSATLLLASTSVGRDNLRTPLHDWAVLTNSRKTSVERCCPSCFAWLEEAPTTNPGRPSSGSGVARSSEMKTILPLHAKAPLKPHPSSDVEGLAPSSDEEGLASTAARGSVYNAESTASPSRDNLSRANLQKMELQTFAMDYLRYGRQETFFHLASGFVAGHAHARMKLQQYFGKVPACMKVLAESEAECQRAEQLLSMIDPALTRTLQTKQFAGAILSRQAAFIDKLVHQGMLSSIEADDMMQQVKVDEQHISTDRKTIIKQMVRSKTKPSHSHQNRPSTGSYNPPDPTSHRIITSSTNTLHEI